MDAILATSLLLFTSCYSRIAIHEVNSSNAVARIVATNGTNYVGSSGRSPQPSNKYNRLLGTRNCAACTALSCYSRTKLANRIVLEFYILQFLKQLIMVDKSFCRSVDLVNSVNKKIIKNKVIIKKDQILVSFSGGQDSICLLLLLNQLCTQMELHLALFWCHHLWQIDSFSLMRQVTKLSFLFQFNGSFAITSKFVPNELLARNWRHSCSHRICLFYNYSKVSLAHSANDKVETMLLNLMRGTGVTGLTPLHWVKTIPEGVVQKEEHISQLFNPPFSSFSWSQLKTQMSNDTEKRNEMREFNSFLKTIALNVNNKVQGFACEAILENLGKNQVCLTFAHKFCLACIVATTQPFYQLRLYLFALSMQPVDCNSFNSTSCGISRVCSNTGTWNKPYLYYIQFALNSFWGLEVKKLFNLVELRSECFYSETALMTSFARSVICFAVKSENNVMDFAKPVYGSCCTSKAGHAGELAMPTSWHNVPIPYDIIYRLYSLSEYCAVLPQPTLHPLHLTYVQDIQLLPALHPLHATHVQDVQHVQQDKQQDTDVNTKVFTNLQTNPYNNFDKFALRKNQVMNAVNQTYITKPTYKKNLSRLVAWSILQTNLINNFFVTSEHFQHAFFILPLRSLLSNPTNKSVPCCHDYVHKTLIKNYQISYSVDSMYTSYFLSKVATLWILEKILLKKRKNSFISLKQLKSQTNKSKKWFYFVSYTFFKACFISF